MPPGDTGGAPFQVTFPDLMTTRNADKTVKAVYDSASPGEWVPLYLDFPVLTETSITWSSSAFQRSLDTRYSVTMSGNPPVPASASSFTTLMPNLPQTTAAAGNDTGLMLSNSTNTFTSANINMPAWIAPYNAAVDQILLNFAVVQNVTVVGAGTATISSVDFAATSFANQGNTDTTSTTQSANITPQTAFTALSAPGTNVFIVKTSLNNLNFKVNRGQLVRFNITVNEALGTITRTIGIAPNFPYYATDVLKQMFRSVIMVHIRPTPDGINSIPQYSGDMSISGVNDKV